MTFSSPRKSCGCRESTTSWLCFVLLTVKHCDPPVLRANFFEQFHQSRVVTECSKKKGRSNIQILMQTNSPTKQQHRFWGNIHHNMRKVTFLTKTLRGSSVRARTVNFSLVVAAIDRCATSRCDHEHFSRNFGARIPGIPKLNQ